MRRVAVVVLVAGCHQQPVRYAFDGFHEHDGTFTEEVYRVRRAHVCDEHDGGPCAKLAVEALHGGPAAPGDPYAILYVACMDAGGLEGCRLAWPEFDKLDPGRWGWTEHSGPDVMRTKILNWACNADEAGACLALFDHERACRAGDRPSCDAIAADEAARRQEEADIETARAARAWEEQHPNGVEDTDEPTSSEPDYLNADECRMANGLACGHIYQGDLDAYGQCMDNTEAGIDDCTRIRCGAQYYNCMAQVWSMSDLDICLELTKRCGIDPAGGS